MCGIAGAFSRTGLPVDKKMLKEMNDTLAHRGPDGEGLYTGAGIGLAHRRLSIIDLSERGAQPMASSDSLIHLVFNGEIYNYVELREELRQRGYSFTSETDTEVIIYAYREWGHDCLSRFNGMWAFALWDEGKKELFCARDRFGVKPFHYWYDGDNYIFASEIKSLLRHPLIEACPNYQAIYDFIIYGRVNHSEETFFRGIYQLPPAHYAVVGPRGLKICRYWDLEGNRHFNGSIEEAADEFYRLFEDSIKLRFRSDVEVASCLSGGLDSSSIVCTADHLIKDGQIKTENRLNTFSLAFDFPQFDERKWVDIVAANTGIRVKFTIPQEKDLLDRLGHLLFTQEEPFGSTSIFGQYKVMELIHDNGIKVTLDGQGSDEILAGYLAYADSYFADLYRAGDTSYLEKQVNIYCAKHNLTPGIALERAKKLAETGKFGRHIEVNGKYLQEEFANKYYKEIALPQKFSSFLQNHLYQDLTQTSIPALLRYEDRNSMAFSIESRVPFLDYRLVEYIFSLPAEMKMKDSVTKVILRRAMKDVLPPEIANRQDKMGFVTPEAVWFREGIAEMLHSIFYGEEIASRGIFNIAAVRQEWEDFKNGSRHDTFIIWRMACVELWFRRFID